MRERRAPALPGAEKGLHADGSESGKGGTKNVCKGKRPETVLSKDRLRAAIAQPLELDAQDAPEPAAGDDTETAALGRAEHAALRAAVDQLPLKYRVPALLAYGAELPLEAIAAIEKLPVGTVKSRLHRAKQMLRQEMEAQGYERQKI